MQGTETDAATAADLEVVMSLEGWMPRPQCAALVELARRVPGDRVIVEIGSFRGRSTVALALGARRGSCRRIYAIDPHDLYVGPVGGKFGPEDQAVLYANLDRTGVGDIVSTVAVRSEVVAPGWPESNIGLLFIDGDHAYDAVRADVENWTPHLADGALLVFDDLGIADVRQVVDERLGAGFMTPVGTAGKLAWFSVGRA